MSDTDSASVNVLQPGINIVKSADRDTASLGDTVVYTYQVQNEDVDPLVGVAVEDDYCAPVVLDTVDANGKLDHGEIWSFSCSYVIQAGDPDPLVNTAEVVGYDPLGNPVRDTAQESVRLANGSIGNYVWDDMNGDGIQDVWEPGLGGVTVILTPDGGAPLTMVTTVSGYYAFTDLLPGDYVVTVDDTTIPVGYAGTTPDPLYVTLAFDENYDAADFGLRNTAPVDLSVTKTDGLASVAAGQVVTYTITVSNAGEQDLTGVLAVDDLPAEGEYVALSASHGGQYLAGPRQVSWQVGALAAGASVERTYQFQVMSTLGAGQLTMTNSVTVSEDGRHGPEETMANNDADDVDDLDAAPTLVATKVDEPYLRCCAGDAVVAGERVKYTVVVTNEGPRDATGVVFGDDAPLHTTLVGLVTTTRGVVVAGNAGGDTVTVSIGELAVGQSATITFVVEVSSVLPAGVAQIANQGQVTATNGDSAPTDDPDTPAADDPTVTLVSAAPDLTVTKTDGRATRGPWRRADLHDDDPQRGQPGCDGRGGDRHSAAVHDLCDGQRLGWRHVQCRAAQGDLDAGGRVGRWRAGDAQLPRDGGCRACGGERASRTRRPPPTTARTAPIPRRATTPARTQTL